MALSRGKRSNREMFFASKPFYTKRKCISPDMLPLVVCCFVRIFYALTGKSGSAVREREKNKSRDAALLTC